MPDLITTSFPAPSRCCRDQGVQHLVASARAVPFRQIGRLSRIEVVGIPALRCQVCDEQIYNLDVLARIESALRRRVERGDVRTLYAFEQLAADLTAGALPS